MSLSTLSELTTVKIYGEVRDGSMIFVDETQQINKLLKKELNWSEVEDSIINCGSYFQAEYSAIVKFSEFKLIEDYYNNL